jgi:hypothetical protein
MFSLIPPVIREAIQGLAKGNIPHPQLTLHLIQESNHSIDELL